MADPEVATPPLPLVGPAFGVFGFDMHSRYGMSAVREALGDRGGDPNDAGKDAPSRRRSDSPEVPRARNEGAKPTSDTSVKGLSSSCQKNSTRRKALQSAPPEAIDSLSKQIRRGGKGIDKEQRQEALNTVVRAAETMSPKARRAFVARFAETMGDNNLGDDSDEFGALLKQSVKDGSGARFGVALVKQLSKTGKGTAAGESAKFVEEGVQDLRSDFKKRSEEMDILNMRAARDVQDFDLDPKAGKRALEQFREDEDYDRKKDELEVSGAKLTSTLDGLAEMAVGEDQCVPGGSHGEQLAKTARSTLRDEVPRLARTQAGATAIAERVKESGAGGTTFIDGLLNMAKESAPAARKLSAAVVEAVGARALSAAHEGRFGKEQKPLFDGLRRIAPLFGASEAQMTRLTTTMGAFRARLSPERVTSVSKELSKQIRALGEKNPRATSLKALSLMFGAAAIPGNVNKAFASDSSVEERVRNISQGLGTTADATGIALNGVTRFMESKSVSSRAPNLSRSLGSKATVAGDALTRFGGPILNGLGATSSAMGAVKEFDNGDIQAGVGDSLSAAGSAVMAISPLLSLTGGGALAAGAAGLALTGVGGIVKALAPTRDPYEADKENIRTTLRIAGLNERTANKLATINGDGQTLASWIRQVAARSDMSTADFMRSMNGWSGKQLADFVDAGKLQHDTDDNNPHRLENARRVLGERADDLRDPTLVATPYAPPSEELIAMFETQRRQQGALRATTSKKTGELVYDDDLVERAATWANGLKLDSMR